jgi:hypothetical protein
MNQPARDHAPAPPPEHQTNYSLSEAAPGALLHEIRLRIRSLTQSQGLVFLALADLTHNRHGHGVSITTRDLCKTAGTSTATVSADLAELESRNLITVRRGHPNRYAVGWWNTIVVADSATNPPANVADLTTEQGRLSLIQRQDDADSATETAAAAMPMPRARETSNSDFHPSIPILDRVFKSEVRDHDRQTLEYIGHRLHSYMAKFGRHDDGRAFLDTPGEPPPPPDKAILARLMATAEPPQLARLLDDLWSEAGQKLAMHPHQENALQPRSYGWFVTIALERIHHIHWSQTAQATADWHVHKKSQQPRAADQPPTVDQLRADVHNLANAKSMGRR